MRQYIARRLLLLIPAALGLTLVIFFLMRVMAGDVAYAILAGEAGEGAVTKEELRELRHKLGTDKPLYEQYIRWAWGIIRLDPGVSLWTERPIVEEIAQRLPVTLELALFTSLVSVSIAIPMGVISAIRQDTWLDYLVRVFSIGGLSLPHFVIATLLVMFLIIWFKWLPPISYVSIFEDPWTNLQQFFFPAITLGYRTNGVICRMMRSCMLEVLREDYIRTAWAKGLRERIIIYRHALKNATLPVVTLIGFQFAFLLGGSVIAETIFSLPGMGKNLVDSITHRDYPVVQAVIVLFGIIVMFSNLVVDILYTWLDPRVRYH